MRGAVDTRVPVRILACEQGRSACAGPRSFGRFFSRRWRSPAGRPACAGPAALRVAFTAGGVSRGSPCSTPHCVCSRNFLRSLPRRWGLPRANQQSTGLLVPALRCRRPVRPLTTAIQKSAPRRDTPGDAFLYAGGGGRTHTVSPPTDFESVSSASSNTPACNS